MYPKQKILYVITQGEWGGAERYVFDLATNLGLDFDVTVAVGEPKGRLDLQDKLTTNNEQLTKKINITQLKHLIRAISPYHDILAIFELAKLYKKLEPDIVHLNSSKAGVAGSLARLFIVHCSLFIVYTVHGWIFNEPLSWLRKNLYFYLEKWTAKMKDGFITLSPFEAEQGQSLLKIPSNKIVVIPHGVPTPAAPLSQAEARGELLAKTGLKISEKNIWIGAIANYYQTKGLDILIQALAKKKNTLPGVICLLIGEGPERARLTQLITANHLDNMVYLAGTVAEAERFLPAFDFLVLPSRKEGLPYVLLEALQAHVPIIAARVGGVPELIKNKKSGLLVNPDSVEDLAEALCFAIKNPGAMKMKEYTQNAPTLPSLSKIVDQTTSLYQALRRQ